MPRKADGIELTIEELTDHARANWPVTSGVPFAPGELAAGEDLTLMRGKTELPLQWEPLVTWPDGSVKWALLDLQADTRAGAKTKLTLARGKPAVPAHRDAGRDAGRGRWPHAH